MHEDAELGVAAHWKYKEGTSGGARSGHEDRIAWLRKLIAWQEEMADSGEMLDEVRSQVFDDRVYVFTPKGDALWLINEEASTLTHYTVNANGTLKEGKTLSALPEGYKGTSFAAGLALSADGKQLYVANRLHNSIGHFTVTAEGTLTHQDDVWTRGDYPRTLTLDKQGRWLYVMNQRSDNITRFRVAQDGKLSFEPDYTPVGSPSQMVISP